MRRTAIATFAAALFVKLFYGVYTLFSYGADAAAFRFAYCFPLLLGTLPALLLYYFGGAGRLSRGAYNVYFAGVATLTTGGIVSGILEIAGRSSEYVRVYPIVGVTLCAAALIAAAADALGV